MNRAEKKAARLRWYKVLEEQLEARQAEEQRAAAARAEQEDEASELSSEPELSLGNVCSPEPLQVGLLPRCAHVRSCASGSAFACRSNHSWCPHVGAQPHSKLI